MKVQLRFKIAIGIFVLFLFMQFIQIKNVFLYFDDFGYASLSYAGLMPHKGPADSIGEILEFLFRHYMHWGGRVVCYFFLVVLLQNIWAIRMGILFVAGGIIWGVYKILMNKNSGHPLLCMSVPILIWNIISVHVMADSVYWFSAAMTYVFPLPFLILAIKMYDDFWSEKEYNTSQYLRMCVCFFGAAFSQEQISVITLVGALSVMILASNKKKVLTKKNVLIIVLICLGICFTVMAPGNFQRMEAVQNTDSILDNWKTLTLFIGTFNFYKYFLLLVLTIIICDYRLFQKYPNCKRRLAILHLLISCGMAGIMALTKDGLISYLHHIISNPLICAGIFWGYIIWAAINIFIFYYLEKDRLMVAFWLMAVSSVGIFIVTGSISNRVFFPFLILAVFIIGDNIINIFESSVKIQSRHIVVCLLIACIGAASLRNWSDIYIGYAKNAEIHEKNDEILSSYRNEPNVQEIILKQVPDRKYGNIMPYFEGYEFVDSFYKAYYELPGDCTIIWQEYNSNDKGE